MPTIDAHIAYPIAAVLVALVSDAQIVGVLGMMVTMVVRVTAILWLLQAPLFLVLLVLLFPVFLANGSCSLHHVLTKGLHSAQDPHSPPSTPPRIVVVLAPTIGAHAAHALFIVVPSISARGQVLLAPALVLPGARRRRGRHVKREHVVLDVAFIQQEARPSRDVRRRGCILQRRQIFVAAVIVRVVLGLGQVQSRRVGLHMQI